MSARGARVLVTGAARGMGALFARRAAAEGAAAIALWDRNAEPLGALAAELRAAAPGSRIETHVLDLADTAAITAAAATTAAAIGGVDILVNNAGIVAAGPFVDQDLDREIVPVMAVNAIAPMVLARALLPGMIARGRPARILTVASAAAFTSTPGMAVYAASKAAALAWADTVRLELERDGHAHVKVTTVCPTFASTGMFAGVRPPLLTPWLEPEQVVEHGWRGMLRGTPIVTLPASVRLARALRGVLPTRGFDVVAGRLFGVYRAMDTFEGRR